jgi:gluconolactonase
MKRVRLPLLLLAAAAHADVTAPDATLTKLAGGFAFTEGPCCDDQGNVYFTDQPNDRILIWTIDGKLQPFLSPCGRANGLCFDGRGRLWSCSDEKNELWRIDVATKQHTVVIKDFEGKLLNGPNDVWVRPDGGLYLTDPYYRRSYWHRGGPEQSQAAVYYLPPDGTKLTRVTDGLKEPNGIIGTPDGKVLYVGDLAGGQTWAYDIAPDGSLSGQRLFCKLGSDGMTIDDEGNVYLCGHGVTIFDKSGRQIQKIPIPGEGWTGNICFGGADRHTLFITASKGLYAIATRVKGVGSQ